MLSITHYIPHVQMLHYYTAYYIWFHVLQHCQFEFVSYTKDLSVISNDLSSIFIMDNSPGAYKSYPSKYASAFVVLYVLKRSILSRILLTDASALYVLVLFILNAVKSLEPRLKKT